MARLFKDVLATALPVNTNWKFLILQQWDACIGDLKMHVRLEKINDDYSLVLSVWQSSWLQELYYLSDILLKKINANLAYPYIKKLRFKYSPRSVHHQYRAPHIPVRTQKAYTLTYSEQQALEKVQDPQLRDALKKFLQRCYQE